jgi:hypothetical protein
MRVSASRMDMAVRELFGFSISYVFNADRKMKRFTR